MTSLRAAINQHTLGPWVRILIRLIGKQTQNCAKGRSTLLVGLAIQIKLGFRSVQVIPREKSRKGFFWPIEIK